MKEWLRRIRKIVVYLTATIVILLAVAVGLFRLFLPRLPEYQDDIKEWASAAIGLQVEFSAMDARWGLSGPELEFDQAQLTRPDDGVPIVAAEKVSVGIGFLRLMTDRTLMVDRLLIQETTIDIHQLADGGFQIQGISADELLANTTGGSDQSVAIEIVGEDIVVNVSREGDPEVYAFEIPDVGVSTDENRIAIDAIVRPPESLGEQLELSATQVLSTPAETRSWDLIVNANDLSLPGWASLSTTRQPVESGTGDFEVAIALDKNGVRHVSAEIDLVNVSVDGSPAFDIGGRFEGDVSSSGWLLAADDFSMRSEDHEWPNSTIRVEASLDDDGSIAMLDSKLSYVALDDLRIAKPWIGANFRKRLVELAPSGVVRNVEVTVSDLAGDEPRFNVQAELSDVGIASANGNPGIRGFSGMLRANRAGGRLEIESRDLTLLAGEYVPQDVALEAIDGTVIWRNSATQTTVLSDSIVIDSDFFESQSNLHLELNKDGSSPRIDLASSWSIADVAKAKRYIPTKGVKPKLRDWFQMALVSGSIPSGRTTLSGPLDKFPFDGGEGQLLVEASVRNLNFKYHPDWPAAEQADLEVIVDNARLYSTENRSLSAGNLVVNANLEIADLRDPVFTTTSLATGSLATIHDFSSQSPIANIFGGQLDRVTVDGDATFSLELAVPLKKERLSEFTFTTTIRSNNGTLAVDGLPQPVTDLIGEVTLTRDTISSNGLGGQFLGEDVAISLARSEDSQFSVVATADGTITEDGLVNGFGLPLAGLVSGATPYRSLILFPDSKSETPQPLTVEISSELNGLAFGLPQPANKDAESILPLSGRIRFLSGGEQIETSGTIQDRLSWQMSFNKPEGAWDMDRGVVMLGGEITESAETRGLHIRGRAAQIRFEDWLALSRSAEGNAGAADRIRSIDVVVHNLFLLGQHIQGHKIRVDRSALDWLIQFDGNDILGSVFVPYDFDAGRAIVLDMERLRFTGDDISDLSESDDIAGIDPRVLPPIHVNAKEFAFGDRNLGAVEARFERTEDGFVANSIRSQDASFSIEGSGRWVADGNDPLGSHSYISAVLTSTDVKQTMERLNYQPGIVSDELRIVFDLDWSGSPRAEIFDVLDGNVDVRFGNGQLEEVDPGAGRVFGLMSITALPRRLSFDFRDVFKKGFGFDKIAGSFVIDDGNTLTCDLSLEGPAADIGIVGVASLNDRTYSQTAVVSANVGNTLPIVGAVVAGPQVAAALLVFSQIFKKPLQEVGQVYYSIDGSWDNPAVESSNSEAFVSSGELAKCFGDSE